MAISLVEADEDVAGNLSQIEKDLRESIAAREAGGEDVNKAAPAANPKVRTLEVNDEELPETLRGKSVAEMARMYMESQSTIGRMANDLGTQRKLTDRLLDLKRESDLSSNGARAPEPVKVDSSELLDNPTQAIERVVSARLQEREKAFREELDSLRRTMSAQTFLERHRDYQSFVNDDGFTSWVQATPYRQGRADAARQGDFGAADELLTEYKDRLASRPKPKDEEDANLKAAAAAALEKGSSAPPASGKKGGKIIKRTDLIALRINNPEAYYDDAYQREIMLAYAEGRVK